MKQVVFSFDTTGSMYPALSQTRRSIAETVRRLFKEIPDLRVGIIAHGDYCDQGSTYVTKHLDLTDDEAAVVRFVNGVGATGGGDAEECYELVLHEARTKMNWKAGDTKVLVMIGDDLPHAPSYRYNTKRIDWKNELDLLLESGVKVYGVQALGRTYATSFYDAISKKTGGVHLNLDQFSHVTDLIFAVCFKQQGDKFLDAFEKEVEKSGRMNRSLDQMFNRLQGRALFPNKERYKSVGGKLKPVPPARFQVIGVDESQSIQEFVNDNLAAPFKPGRGFYELTKPVKVQSYKEVVLRDRLTGDMYTGPGAREMVGLPTGEDAKLRPVDLEKYEVFIQSTSFNRKLLGGTKFLYEVNEFSA